MHCMPDEAYDGRNIALNYQVCSIVQRRHSARYSSLLSRRLGPRVHPGGLDNYFTLTMIRCMQHDTSIFDTVTGVKSNVIILEMAHEGVVKEWAAKGLRPSERS